MSYIHVKNWRLKHPGARRAQMRVYAAIRNGSLKKEPCFCGETKSEAHHPDYREHLKIVWLCKKHHAQADRMRRKNESSPYVKYCMRCEIILSDEEQKLGKICNLCSDRTPVHNSVAL